MGRNYANKLIASSQVVDNVGTIVPKQDVDNCIQKPMTESQARPLTRLSAPLQVEAWNKVVETAPDGKITARHINQVVFEIEGKEGRKKLIRVKNPEVTEAMHFANEANKL